MNQRRIKLCFIAPKAYPIFNPAVKEVFGGAQLDLYLLANELAKDDAFEVNFITADYGQPQIEKIGNVRIIRSLKFGQNPITSSWRLINAMRLANSDIYFLKASAAGAFLVAIYCRIMRKKFIYRTASQGESDGTYIKKNPFAGRLFKLALKLADNVFVQNESDRKNLLSTTGVEAVRIPNGHNIDVANNTGLKNSILWCGRSEHVKRPDLFIKLAAEFPNERFVMICQRNINDNNYDDLIASAKQVPNLEFIEHVPFQQVDSYFKNAKVLVNTSDSEGFPNTFIQACKWAVPILSLNVNPDEFLTNSKCGFCGSGQWSHFKSSLCALFETDTWNLYSQNALYYAHEHHDIKQIAQIYKPHLL